MKNIIKKISSVFLAIFTVLCLYFMIKGKVGIISAYGLIAFNGVRVVLETYTVKIIVDRLNISESLKEEIPRKTGHMLACFVTFPMIYFSFKNTIHMPICLGILTITFFIICKLGLLKMIKRNDENSSNVMGCIYMIGGAFIISIFSYINNGLLVPHALSIMSLGLGDPMACIIGKKFGKHKFKNGKSVEGIIGFIIGATIAMYIFSHIAIWKLLIIATVGALTEFYSGDYDNLLIQIFVTLSAFIII